MSSFHTPVPNPRFLIIAHTESTLSSRAKLQSTSQKWKFWHRQKMLTIRLCDQTQNFAISYSFVENLTFCAIPSQFLLYRALDPVPQAWVYKEISALHHNGTHNELSCSLNCSQRIFDWNPKDFAAKIVCVYMQRVNTPSAEIGRKYQSRHLVLSDLSTMTSQYFAARDFSRGVQMEEAWKIDTQNWKRWKLHPRIFETDRN